MSNVEACIEIITPDRAEKIWANRNFENRKLSSIMVDRFASDMKSGIWQMNGQGIVFDSGGRLVDGHHRISACIRAKSSFTTLVARGVDPASVDVIDSGHSRSLGHIAQMRGIPNANAVVSAARLLMAYHRLREGIFSLEGHDHYSYSDVLAYVDEHPRIIESARRVISMKRILRSSVAGLLHFLLCKADAKNAEWFFERIVTGSDMQNDHPALVLRNRLLKLRETHAKVDDFSLIHMGIRSWNHFVCGSSVKIIALEKGKALPQILTLKEHSKNDRWTI